MANVSHRANELANILSPQTGGEHIPTLVNPALSGRLFANARDVVLTHVVSVTTGEVPFLFGTVKRGPRGTRGARVVAVTLPRPVPNMVLMSARSSVLRSAGITLDESQKLQLEGDFNSSFTLYCPAHYGTDALYIFTPDLMAKLVDTVGGCDVEFVDNRLLLYVPSAAFTPSESVSRVPDLLAYLNGTLERRTRLYRDDLSEAATVQDPFRRDQLLAVGGYDAGHRIGRDGHRVRTRLNGFQKTGVAFGIVAALAAGIYWVTSVVSAFV